MLLLVGDNKAKGEITLIVILSDSEESANYASAARQILRDAQNDKLLVFPIYIKEDVIA